MRPWYNYLEILQTCANHQISVLWTSENKIFDTKWREMFSIQDILQTDIDQGGDLKRKHGKIVEQQAAGGE